MKRFFLAFILFSVWFSIAGTYYTFVIKGVDNEGKIVETPKKNEPKEKVTITAEEKINVEKNDTIQETETLTIKTPDSLKINGLVLKDQDYILKKYFGNFKIYEKSDKVQIPFGISEYGYVIAKHMDSINSNLVIEGFYNQDEIAENGVKRALFLKNKLVKLGIPDSLITAKSTEAIFDYTYKKFVGGINFEFTKASSNFELNKIDYSKLVKETAETENFIADVTPVETIKQDPVKVETKKNDQKIIDKKEALPSTNIKNTATKSIEKVSFTVLNTDFKNGKFKPNRKFKAFLETNASGKSLELLGFSNSDLESEKNYTKGIEIANTVNEYIKKKELFSGPTKISALKKEKNSNENLLREGVTLLIIK